MKIIEDNNSGVAMNTMRFEDIPLPEAVFKYRSWNDQRHKRILTHNEIHFDSPFNSANSVRDELICKWDWESVSYFEMYMKYYDRATDFGIFGDKNRHEFARSNIHRAAIWSIKTIYEFEINQKHNLNARVSIFCVSANRENYQLWEDFADYQRGFCIGFNSRKLFSDFDRFGFGKKVNYFKSNDVPLIPPFYYNMAKEMDSYGKRITSLPWKFHKEEEYRLAKIDLEEKTFSIPSEAYNEVILGSDMNGNSKEEIICLVKSRFPNCKLYQAVYNSTYESYGFVSIS